MSSLVILSEEQIEEFINSGILVIPNIISNDEVQTILIGFSACLSKFGVDTNDLAKSSSSLSKLSSTNGSGGVLDIFYDSFKLPYSEDVRIVGALQDLWSRTYATYTTGSEESLFSHPFGPFDPRQGYMYIDRVCYRVPSGDVANQSKKKQLQRPLGPHLDCCPHNMHKGRKWRPIQAFIALTDTVEENMGGFEACPGMHKDFYTWAANREGTNVGTDNEQPPPCVGDFTPIRPLEDRAVIERFRHIPCRAGDMICWDNRIPHANARLNLGTIPRQVIYIGLLPAIELNKQYAKDQLERYKRGELPVDQWHSQKGLQLCNYEFSELGKKLMTIEEW